MKRAHKLWTAFLMTAVMTMSMGIPTVFAEDANDENGVIETEYVADGEDVQGGSPSVASLEDEGAEPAADGGIVSEVDGDDELATPASADGEDEPVAILADAGTYTFSGGTGVEGSPYEIATEADLIALATNVNDGVAGYNTAYYELTANIKLTEDFTPIGKYGATFQGTFDGKSKTISAEDGIVIGASGTNCQGLFGYIDSSATISNVTVSVDVVGYSSVGGVVGYASTSSGTITISNCYNTGNVTSSESCVSGVVGYAETSSGTINISNCYNTGNVEGSTQVGGVVGYVCETSDATITISNCYNTGDITGVAVVGGIVGQNDGGTVTSCYNTGDITGSAAVGGIVGQVGTSDATGSTVEYCYNTGAVTGGTAGESVGGLVGTSYGTVQYCYNTGAVSGKGVLGGLVGDNSNGKVKCSYNIGAVTCSGGTPSSAHGGVVGSNELNGSSGTIASCYYNDDIFVDTTVSNELGEALTTKQMTGTTDTGRANTSVTMAALNTDDDTTDGVDNTTAFKFTADSGTTIGYYPVLTSNTQTPAPSAILGLTAVDGVYQIANEADLRTFSVIVNDGYSFEGETVVLTDNIELESNFSAIGSVVSGTKYSFSGTFDGGDYTISVADGESATIVSSSRDDNYVGLFGYISDTAIIENVTVDVPVSGNEAVGGIVGYSAGGKVSNCTNIGTVEGTSAFVGGIVGQNVGGTVENCTNLGDVTSTGYDNIGGVVGYSDGDTITSCTNEGAVNGAGSVGGVVGSSNNTAVTDCTNSGNVTGSGDNVGGVVGISNADGDTASVSGCSNSGAVTGVSDVGGVVGTNTDGTVENCSNSGDVTATKDEQDYSNVGGVVGCNNANTLDSGVATVTGCSNTGDVTGVGDNVGGVVGFNEANSDDVSAIVEDSTNTGTVTGADNVGGVVGYNYASGENATASVTSCSSTNTVTGGEYVGVIVGRNDGSELVDCTTISTGSSSSSYYIKAKAIGNGTVAPEDEDASPDSMYKVTKGSDVTFVFDADSGYEVTDVKVDGASVGVCDEYEFENISYTMQTLEVVFEKSSTSSDDEEDEEDADTDEDLADTDAILLPFGDVDEDDDNYEGIAYVYENGIMAGISSEEFGGDMSITRGMIAAILYRINGSEPVDAELLFDDISPDQYYVEAVKWGKMAGVMAGVSETEFAPDTQITNEQLLAFLYRYATYLGMDMTVEYAYDLSAYTMNDYAVPAIAWALENDIIDDDDLVAMADALRGNVATTLMNFMEM